MEIVLALVALAVAIGVQRRFAALNERLRRVEAEMAKLLGTPLPQMPPEPARRGQLDDFAPPAPARPEERTGPAPAAAATSGPPPEPALAAEPEGAPAERPVPAEEAGRGGAPRPASAAPWRPSRPPGSPPPPPVPPATPAAPPRSFEERFGTRWVVWVGGLALALGGVFLVQYSIEAGLIGPGMRIFLGALLAALLLGAGELMRRREAPLGLANIPTANIPAILTAAGTVVAFADVYAAHALYDFLDPAAAFVLLGAVAVATLFGSLLHGPWLAGLGLAGAYATPLMVVSDRPNHWALFVYLALVTAAAFVLASARKWQWLAVTALGFSVLWALAVLLDPTGEALRPLAFHIVAGFALAAAFLVSGFLYGPPSPGRIEPLSSAALGVYLLLAGLLVLTGGLDPLPMIVFGLLAAATIAIAWRAEAAIGAVALGALLLAPVAIDWLAAVEVDLSNGLPPQVMFGIAPVSGLESRDIIIGWVLAIFFALAGFAAQGRHGRALEPIVWASAGVLAPIAMLAATYLRTAGLERSLPLAAVALAFAFAAALATEALVRRESRPGIASAAAVFAAGSASALALALTFALEKGSLTVGLALMAPGIAFVATRRSLPLLRWLCAAVATIVAVRVGLDPTIAGRAADSPPVFNWLLYGYGVPALAFWLAGALLRRRADDVPARSLESAAILFTALLLFFEIQNWAEGEPGVRISGLTEAALYVCSALAMAIGLEWLRRRSASPVRNVAALIFAGIGVAGALVVLGVFENPLFQGVAVGGPVINLLFLAYALPALLLAALGLLARRTRPEWFGAIAAVTAVIMTLLYLTLEVRRFFHGPVLSVSGFLDAEQYTISAVWLTFGVLLLLAGILIRSQPVRFASAAVVLLTIGKVFLFDLAGLTGFFRALSFIVLGVVLIGIGWLYQRLLFPRAPSPPDESSTPGKAL